MKIRQGFVSNSSSSSFILVGIKLDGNLTDEELAKKYIKEYAIKEHIGTDADNFTGEDWRDLWYECAYSGDFINEDMNFISSDGDSWLGKILTDGDELADGEFSISELTEIAEKLDFKECKIYFGTRQC